MGIFVMSCAATKLTSVYKNPSYTDGSLTSILIVGFSDNLRNRQLFEDTFVNALNSRGINAVSSLTVIPKNTELTKESIKAAADQLKTDAVLITHLVGVEEKEIEHAPVIVSMPSERYQFGPYVETIYRDVYLPGNTTQHEFVTLQNELYDTQTETLVWSAASEIMDPESVNKTIESLCEVVIKDLRKKNLVK
jgi:hypothetical protein